MNKPTTETKYFEQFINVPIIRSGRKLQNMFFRVALKPEGISLQEWRVLLILDSLGDTHLRELARVGHLDPTHASRASRSMEVKGWLTRYRDKADTRRMRFVITDAGRDVIDRVWPKARAMDAHIRAAIGEENHAALYRACRAILDAPEFEADARDAVAAE